MSLNKVLGICLVVIGLFMILGSVAYAQQKPQISEEGVSLLARLEGVQGTVADIKKRLEYQKSQLEQQAQSQPTDPKAAHRAKVMRRLSGHLRPGGRATASNMRNPTYMRARQMWFHRMNEDVAKLEDDIAVLRAALHKTGAQDKEDQQKFNDELERLRLKAQELAKRVEDR